MGLQSNLKGMIFIETENKIVKDVLNERIGLNSSRPVEPMDLRICDFDDVHYNVVIQDDVLSFSMAYPAYETLCTYGVQQMLAKKYAKMEVVKSSFDVTLKVNVSNVVGSEASAIVDLLANLKRNCLGEPLEQCFMALKNGKGDGLSSIEIPFRKLESMYVRPQDDRIIVVYSVVFEDKTDQAIAKTFLQEFADAGRSVNNAPPISFSKDPPLELRGAPGLPTCDQLVGYLSFAIFPSHVNTDTKCFQTISLLQGFRNYLYYHIKSTKSYLHMRMRKRVNNLLHVLNRAHPEKNPSKVNKKTITGKTFIRN